MGEKTDKPVEQQDATAPEAEANYDREAKLKELLDQDQKNPFADPFMGF